jgi:CRISPR/Cas system-associated protein Cas10 (large subunit of type III CRISPR-Cas system)
MNEARKTTAQYLNGLAVAVLATTGGAFIGKNVSLDILLLAALLSLAAHACALWLVRE